MDNLLLYVKNLGIKFNTNDGVFEAVNNISFKIKNVEQLVHRIDKSFLKKTNFSKKTDKLKKLGSIILSKTYSELDNYL